MFYTSYFGNFKHVKNPVSICGKSPSFYTGPQYKKLAPRYEMFIEWKNGTIDNDGYTIKYNEMLSELDAKDVCADLQSFYPNEDVTLLCYEKPCDFCHRHLVAEWLRKNGFEIKEMEK